MHKFNLMQSHVQSSQERFLANLTEKRLHNRKIMRRATLGMALMHLALFDEAVMHISKRIGLEVMMVLTNQPAKNKAVLRNNFEIVAEREKRRLVGIRRNKPAYRAFVEQVKPVLDGSLASAEHLTGDFHPEKLISQFEALTLEVKPNTIEKAKTNHTAALAAILEEVPGPQITRARLHATIDHIAPGDAYELSRSSSQESAALNFAKGTQNCDSRNSNLIISLLRQDPNSLKNIFVQQFVDHVRVLYQIDGHKYILEKGANRFPDKRSLEVRSAVMPAAGYLAMRITGKSISELEGVQYFGVKKILDDDMKIAITDLRLNYYQAMDIAKLITDFSGLGYFASSQTEMNRSIMGPNARSGQASNSSQAANLYQDELGEAEAESERTRNNSIPPKPAFSFLSEKAIASTPAKESQPVIVKDKPRENPVPAVNRIPQEVLDKILADKKAEQGKVEKQIKNIENGFAPDHGLGGDQAFFEVTFFEDKPLDREEYKKFQKKMEDALKIDKFQETIKLMNEAEKAKFMKFFNKEGVLTADFKTLMFFAEDLSVQDPTVKRSIVSDLQSPFTSREKMLAELQIYSEIESSVLLDIFAKKIDVATQDGQKQSFMLPNAIHIPFKLSLDNIEKLLQKKVPFRVNASRIHPSGLALIIQSQVPVIIVADSDLEVRLDSLTVPVKNPALYFDLQGEKVKSGLAAKMTNLNVKVFLLNAQTTPEARTILEQAPKPVILNEHKQTTAILFENYLRNFQPDQLKLHLEVSDLTVELAQVIKKFPNKPVSFSGLSTIKPEAAEVINRPDPISLYNLQYLSSNSAKKFTGEGDLIFPVSALTLESLQALGDRPDRFWKSLQLSSGESSISKIRELYFQSKKLAQSPDQKSKLALQNLLENNQKTLNIINVLSNLIHYPGLIHSENILVNIEDLEMLSQRTNQIAVANLIILSERDLSETEQKNLQEKLLKIEKLKFSQLSVNFGQPFRVSPEDFAPADGKDSPNLP